MMSKVRKFSDWIIIFIKGLAIGSADVVPGGISGGTIAFITGVYEELLESIKSINLTAFKLLFSLKFRQFWKQINGTFFLMLLGGVVTAIFSLAGVMLYLVETFPIVMWSFFFGLIIASTYVVAKDIKVWNWLTFIHIAIGLGLAAIIMAMTPASTPETWWFVMFSGAVAICAMILPGISGAFMLLLMGKYTFLMNAVKELKWGVIALFAGGAIIGIVCFSHIFSWLLKKYNRATLSVIVGFLAGSLYKIWPWKEVISTYTDSHGKELPFLEKNILPGAYESLFGVDPMVWQALGCCVAGFLLIYAIEAISKRTSKSKKLK